MKLLRLSYLGGFGDGQAVVRNTRSCLIFVCLVFCSKLYCPDSRRSKFEDHSCHKGLCNSS